MITGEPKANPGSPVRGIVQSGDWGARTARTLATLLVVAAVAGMSFLLQLDAVSAALLFLLLGLCIAVLAGPVLSLLAAVVSFLCLDYFFLQPLFSFAVHWRDPREILTLMAFAVLAGVVVPAVATLYRALRASQAARLALAQSEERFALAVAGSTDGLWDWNILTDEMFFSERTQRIYGLEPGPTTRPRADWRAAVVIHPDDVQPQLRMVEDYLKGSAPRYEGEWRVRDQDGNFRWVRIRGLCVRDAAGRPTRLAGSASDIDARKRTEEALRRSQAYLGEALRLARSGSFAFDTRRNVYVHWSPELSLIYGLDPNQGIPSLDMLWDRIHPDDVPRVHRERTMAIAQRRDFTSDYRVRHSAGSYRHVHVVAHHTHDSAGNATELVGILMDVTERKLAEAALQESETRFALAAAGANEGIWDRDRINNRLYLSERAQRIYGVEPGLPVRSLEQWRALIPFHPEDAEAQRMAVEDYIAGRTAVLDWEFRILHPDGQIHWLRVRGQCERDASGYATRLAGSVVDITESKRAEAALLESETRFALAVAGSNEGIWDRDRVNNRLFLSERAQQIYGLRPGPTVRPLGEWRKVVRFHPDDIEKRRRAVDDYIDGRSPVLDCEFRVLHPDGQYRWLRVRGLCVRNAAGYATRLAGSLEDIHDRKVAQEQVERGKEELRARQEMLDLAQKAARAVAFDWRIDVPDGQNAWTPDLETMYGLSPGTYDGTFKGWKSLIFAEDWPAVRDAVLHANQTGEVAAEYRVKHRSGAVRWLQAKGRMLFNANGEPSRLIGFMLDVTERREAEDELRRLERQLRQAQRLEAMGTLAGGIAHDFNNILGAILGYGEMALRDAAPGSRLRRDLDSIIVAGERGRALVERILTFSRSGVGERIAVPVEQVIREALDLLAARLPEGVQVEDALLAGRAAMQGDPTQVHQVLMNLATNAVQAMPNGGRLRVALTPHCLPVPYVATTGTVAAGEYIVLEVADQGTGIPAHLLERIFDPFFTTKEVGVGTGLGLSLVHGIVTEVGGAIDVATREGKGSTFTVYLPRSGDAEHVEQGHEPEMPRGSGQRILIVDDEEALVRLVSETLEELGYVPAGFTSSSAALAAFRSAPDAFDAVITDERMPDIPGHQLISEMRGIRRDLPILLASGYLGGSVVDRAYNAGADEVLRKPLSALDLSMSLARVLAREAAGKALQG